ncbi:hypothetical protein H4R19_000092 [Coemansia spiralis]|nr:hypothetical protein H4R19_000092 [Coemansia spiralis]
MPTYQVVRCAGDSCAKFQTQQEKKANKWTCVVCGLKQSLRRVYLQSTTPKDCRAAVMELNMSRGQAEMTKALCMDSMSAEPRRTATTSSAASSEMSGGHLQPDPASRAAPEMSRWDEFADDASADTADPLARGSDAEHGLDRHNRVVVGCVEPGASAAPKRAGRKPQNPRPTRRQRTENDPASTTACHAPNHKTQTQETPLPAPTLSQALATLSQTRQRVAGAQGNAGTCAPPSREPAKQDGPSRWNCYASDSESASD